MKSFIKLVNFEVNRFFKLYLVLIGLTIASQLIGSIVVSKSYVKDVEEYLVENLMSRSELIGNFNMSPFNQYFGTAFFILPIVLCIATLMIYVFFIWYRDWLGKNTFIYRLLMLPVERINLYFSKLTAIMLFVLGLIALQIILVPIEVQIIEGIVPADLRKEFEWLESFHVLSILSYLYPPTATEFILIYGIGLIFVAVVFTAILIERSYRLKGIFFAIVYGVISFFVFISPLLLDSDYFYPMEIFIMMLITSAIVLGSAIWIAHRLLKYKIRV